MEATFLSDAICKIKEMAQKATDPTFKTINGEEYVFYGNGSSQKLEAITWHPCNFTVYSLDALVQIVKTEAVKTFERSPIYLSCESYQEVSAYLQVDYDDECRRLRPYTAKATDVPGFRDCEWSFEQAMIALRAKFQQTPDITYMLELLSHMSVDQSVQNDDNGVTQTVQVKKGISFVQNEQVRPIVTLAPYRTFQEVEQPQSEFVFRVDDKRNVTLAEADGGMWRIAARRTVKDYLTQELADEIAAGRVIVTL